MKEHGPWRIHSTREVYRDPWVGLTVDDVTRPDGSSGTFSVAHVRPGVAVLALDDRGCVYLAEEFRYALGRRSLEAVSGGADPGEAPAATARRELREELGIEAADWTDLGAVDPFTSMVRGTVRLFLARGLSACHRSSSTEAVVQRRGGHKVATALVDFEPLEPPRVGVAGEEFARRDGLAALHVNRHVLLELERTMAAVVIRHDDQQGRDLV